MTILAPVICDSINPSADRLHTRPTLQEVTDRLSYNELTGIFIWKYSPNGRVPRDSIAGFRTRKGHICIIIKRKQYQAHHLAWLFMTGKWPDKQVDHIDRNPGNNIWKNLREATNGQNRANSKSSTVSGIKGVYKNARGSRWFSVIRVNKILIRLGSFSNPEEAAKAYRTAAIKYHGEFANYD